MSEETTVTAIFAFRAEGGPWFGPHDALPIGQYTDATIGFTALDSLAAQNMFAGKVIHVRFGEWPQKHVAEVAPPAHLSDGSKLPVQLTFDVEDVLFKGDWVAPVCRATIALNNTIADVADVDPALRSAALDAANALRTRAAAEMVPGATAADKAAADAAFLDTVRTALAVGGVTEKITEDGRVALGRLGGLVGDYDGRRNAAAR